MQSRTVYHWQSRRDDRAITLRIREIVETRIRYGCPRIHIQLQLQREGWLVNHKKTHRIYYLEGLNLRRKRPRRHVSAARRQPRPALMHIDQCWSMDFMLDNGSEFISKSLDKWVYEHGVTIDFSRPGKPRLLNHLTVVCGMNA